MDWFDHWLLALEEIKFKEEIFPMDSAGMYIQALESKAQRRKFSEVFSMDLILK